MACVYTDRITCIDSGLSTMYTLENPEHLLRHKDGFIIVAVIFGEIHEQVNITCK